MTEKTKTHGAYAGRRFTTTNKLFFCWLVGVEEQLFKKQLVSFAKIGEQFHLTTNADGSSVFTAGADRPEMIEGVLHAEHRAWIVKDTAAAAAFDERRARLRLEARPSELDSALKPLRELLRHAHTHRDRAALIAYITAELWRRDP